MMSLSVSQQCSENLIFAGYEDRFHCSSPARALLLEHCYLSPWPIASTVRCKGQKLARDRGVKEPSQASILGSKVTTGRFPPPTPASYCPNSYLLRNVGFLRYWSILNLPLFLLAAPMLYILFRSAVWGWTQAPKLPLRTPAKMKGSKDLPSSSPPDIWLLTTRDIVGRFALPQFILAVLALTSYHVQIINRISSGYPVWYWWLATTIVDQHEVQLFGRRWNTAKVGLRWMVLYATIQGGLFSSFLPPA